MKVSDYFFTDYYHKYITIEADFLTEKLKKEIKVHEDDCYALCSSYLDEEGYLNFNVLSIGPSWAECTRGLKKKSMLGSFGIDEVYLIFIPLHLKINIYGNLNIFFIFLSIPLLLLIILLHFSYILYAKF